MVKFFLGSNKLIASVKGIGSKVFSGRRFLFVVLPLIVLAIFIVLYVYLNNMGSCSGVINKSENSLKNANSKDDFTSTYKNLQKGGKHCAIKKGFLGLGSSKNSSTDKLQQLRYYHDKATVGYRLGNFVQSKKDAESGLTIDKQLQNSEKTSKNYSQLVQDLKWIKEGTF